MQSICSDPQNLCNLGSRVFCHLYNPVGHLDLSSKKRNRNGAVLTRRSGSVEEYPRIGTSKEWNDGKDDQVIQQILRHANVSTTNEYLREDGERGCGECDEEPGNNVCNQCATRQARKYANDVGVFSRSSQQVSTLDAVRVIWRRGGIRTPGTSFSSYNGLAICPFHCLLFGINQLHSGKMPWFGAYTAHLG
jgi:hypothetical protein